MANLDKFFKADTSTMTHPKIRVWKPLIESNPSTIYCEIHRKREGLGFLPSEIYLFYKQKPEDLLQDSKDDWDDDLNQFLIDNGIKAIDEKNEALRFDLMLARFLQGIEIRYGEGYFNAVLLQVIESNFGSDERIAEMLKKVGPGNPHKGSSYLHVVETVEGAIKKCADLLVDKLHYLVEPAGRILTDAVGGYMDERFSITNLK